MKKFILAATALALGTVFAWAAAEDDREAAMKERGRAIGALAKVAKGETPFDAAAVLEQLTALQANAEKTDIDALWPAGSQGDSRSSPKIWEDMAGFKAENDKYRAAVAAAVAAPPADVAALQASVGAIGKECAACHEAYRIKR